CDSMAGHLMSKGEVDMIVVGADRIATNGDTANKIGTYSLAVLANYHKVPFYIAAPLSTFDRELSSGKQIPIEYRDEKEVTNLAGQTITVVGARAMNPAFDVTPAELIAGIITEAGILRPDYRQSIAEAFKQA
ncbi:MAG: S-methyl-5-thioribose-1-phosphate isomerase, partial [Cyanobacteria bacterium]|nr:S-methyl-5-thioribose-1-phosphate isomerase [Cyanobacteriota bacterium]